MALFGRFLLEELARGENIEHFEEVLEVVETWRNDYYNGSLQRDSETQREQAFNQDFFMRILGYESKPSKTYTFEPKSSTQTGEIPDARIGFLSSGVLSTVAVVELKSASTNLDKPQFRQGKMSPVQQGFKYKPLYPGCRFVIVSNFFEIRLYADNIFDYESWTLDSLVDPADDYLELRKFVTVLRARNLLPHAGVSSTESRLSNVHYEFEEVGKKFFAEYREARLELLRDIWKRNPNLRSNADLIISSAQLILDRMIFAMFAEDNGILPDFTIAKLSETVGNSFAGVWSNIKMFFETLNTGSEKLGIPQGFNGGFFAADGLTDSLQISDEPFSSILALHRFDFKNQLSVTLLGEIFEMSITEIEAIKEAIEGEDNLDFSSISKRKLDGVYYTPQFVVKAIIQRTLGAYLSEKEREFLRESRVEKASSEGVFEKANRKAYLKYRDFLATVRVVDPACGSGAFLVEAFDFLAMEQLRVAQILDNDLLGAKQIYSEVLRSNIYGVDIDPVAVQITRLSLWLKSASRGEQLTTLDDHIVVGNSLEPEGTTFTWESMFGEILQEGFDIVVGNPPYIKEYINKSAFDGLREKPLYQGKMDLWYFFVGVGLQLLKPRTGLLGFIAPTNWVTNAGAQKMRDHMLVSSQLVSCFDFGDFQVFADAGIQTMIFVLRKEDNPPKSYEVEYSTLENPKATIGDISRALSGEEVRDVRNFSSPLIPENWLGGTIRFNESRVSEALELILQGGPERFESSEIGTGIDVHQDFLNKKGKAILGDKAEVDDGIFVLSKMEVERMKLLSNELQLLKPYFTSRQLHRYWMDKVTDLSVIYTDSTFKNPKRIEAFPNLKEHFDKFSPVITSDNGPYGLHRARDERFFKDPTIISVRKSLRPVFTLAKEEAYVSQTFFCIQSSRWEIRTLTAILNSSLVCFWLLHRGKMQGSIFQVDKAPLLEIPLPPRGENPLLVSLVDQIIQLEEEILGIEYRLGQSIPAIGQASSLPASWWSKEPSTIFSDSGMSPKEVFEVVPLLQEASVDVAEMRRKVSDLELEVDNAVFDLYGIPENIRVVILREVPPL